MKSLKLILISVSYMAIALLLFSSCSTDKKKSPVVDSAKIAISGTMEAEMTDPPFVPTPVGNRPAKKINRKHGNS